MCWCCIAAASRAGEDHLLTPPSSALEVVRGHERRDVRRRYARLGEPGGPFLGVDRHLYPRLGVWLLRTTARAGAVNDGVGATLGAPTVALAFPAHPCRCVGREQVAHGRYGDLGVLVHCLPAVGDVLRQVPGADPQVPQVAPQPTRRASRRYGSGEEVEPVPSGTLRYGCALGDEGFVLEQLNERDQALPEAQADALEVLRVGSLRSSWRQRLGPSVPRAHRGASPVAR